MTERLRDFYRATNPDEARQLLEELQGHCLKRAMPPDVQWWRGLDLNQRPLGYETDIVPPAGYDR